MLMYKKNRSMHSQGHMDIYMLVIHFPSSPGARLCDALQPKRYTVLLRNEMSPLRCDVTLNFFGHVSSPKTIVHGHSEVHAL